MKTKFFYLAMYILAVLPLMTACESDDPPATDEPTEQTQLATPVVAVNVDINAQTITASWQAVEHADNYHYKISGDETLYETGATRLELQPYSKFEGGSHSITVQAVSNAQPDLFSPSEWGKADFSVESTKLQAPDALNADVNKESCTVTVTWAPVANAASYLYKIDDGKEVPVDEPGISFSLFDYAPGEHSVSVKALAEGDAPTGRSASVKAVTAVASSDWSEVYTFTITDEPLPGVWWNYARWCNALREDKNFGLTRDSGTRKEHEGAYMGTIDSEDDFNGYYNCMAMLEYIAATNHACCEYPALTLAINGKIHIMVKQGIIKTFWSK